MLLKVTDKCCRSADNVKSRNAFACRTRGHGQTAYLVVYMEDLLVFSMDIEQLCGSVNEVWNGFFPPVLLSNNSST